MKVNKLVFPTLIDISTFETGNYDIDLHILYEKTINSFEFSELNICISIGASEKPKKKKNFYLTNSQKALSHALEMEQGTKKKCSKASVLFLLFSFISYFMSTICHKSSFRICFYYFFLLQDINNLLTQPRMKRLGCPPAIYLCCRNKMS